MIQWGMTFKLLKEIVSTGNISSLKVRIVIKALIFICFAVINYREYSPRWLKAVETIKVQLGAVRVLIPYFMDGYMILERVMWMLMTKITMTLSL